MKILNDYSDEMNRLSNEMTQLYSPSIARETQSKYAESYVKMSDAAFYYYMALRDNSTSYYEKSRESVQEANRIGSDAYTYFEDLLRKYNISCKEINFCEERKQTTKP